VPKGAERLLLELVLLPDEAQQDPVEDAAVLAVEEREEREGDVDQGARDVGVVAVRDARVDAVLERIP
jgi:hypothetical protein